MLIDNLVYLLHHLCHHKGAAANKAAAMATAMIGRGVPEGEAIATANKHAKKGFGAVPKKTK